MEDVLADLKGPAGVLEWFLCSPTQRAVQDAFFGAIKWQDGEWVRSRIRYSWLEEVRQKFFGVLSELVEEFGERLSCAFSELVAGRGGEEVWELADLTPEQAKAIEGFKDPSKMLFRVRPLWKEGDSPCLNTISSRL